MEDMTLTIIGEAGVHISPNGTRKKKVLVRCYCGTEFITTGAGIRNGNTKSCGCYHKKRASEAKTTHGLSGKKLFTTYRNMISRCYNSDAKDYGSYGRLGVTVCDEWKNSPELFIEWAEANGYKPTLTIDRIDPKKGYYPDNCRFVDLYVQAQNKKFKCKNTKSEYKGVELLPSGNWSARITDNSKRIGLGTYPTDKEAAKAYNRYIDENNTHHTKNIIKEDNEV